MASERTEDFESEDDEEEELDPRVKLELEKLNVAADGVNHLETEYGEAQTLFNQMRGDAGIQLTFLKQKLGKSVEKARPYYDILRKARQAKIALHHAALQFENAQSVHDLARKKVSEAERRANTDDGRINSAMQEMLNQANLDVMEAVRQKTECWKAHQLTAQVFEEEQKKLTDLSKSLSKVITKSRPYFDLKMTLNKNLEEQKERIENIHVGIQVAKKEYGATLLRLEKISNEIHSMRRMRKLNAVYATPREQGVGAESTSEDEGFISGSLGHSTKGTEIKIADFDEVSAFGDDTVSVGTSDQDSDSHMSPTSNSGTVVFDFQSTRKVTRSDSAYEVISSKVVKIPPLVTDFFEDDVSFTDNSKLYPNLVKRWKSLTSIEKDLGVSWPAEKEKLSRSSSFTFRFLRNRAKGSTQPQRQSSLVNDITQEYDIIDGKRVLVDKNANKSFVNVPDDDQRYPGEGCDAVTTPPPTDQNVEPVVTADTSTANSSEPVS